MTIVKNRYGISKLDGDFSQGADLIEEEDGSLFSRCAGDDVLDDGTSDADSGMASDEFEFSEFAEPGMDLCEVGNQRFMFPLELYDLPNLGSILSIDTWNVCLSEEERFALAEYLPDVDQEDFAVTLKELFSGSNFHFSCPLSDFFDQLKGGLCDPTVVLERRGLKIFQWQQHYHRLRKYHNSMVLSLIKIRDAWESCDQYGIEERLRFLNILRNQRSLGYGRTSETDSGSCESDEAYLNRGLHKGRGSLHSSKNAFFTQGTRMVKEEPVEFVKEKVKGILKVASSKKESVRSPGFDLSNAGRRTAEENCFQDPRYGSDWARQTNVTNNVSMKSKRKNSVKRSAQDMQSDFAEDYPDEYVRSSSSLNTRKNSGLSVTVASYDSYDCDALNRMRKPKRDENCKYPAKEFHKESTVYLSDANKSNNPTRRYPAGWTLPPSDANWSRRRAEVYRETSCLNHPDEFGDSRGQKRKAGKDFRTNNNTCLDFDSKVCSSKAPSAEKIDSSFRSGHRTKTLQKQLRRKASHPERACLEYSKYTPFYAQSDEPRSDSSGEVEEGRDMHPYAKKIVHRNEVKDARQSGKVTNFIEKLQPASLGSCSASRKRKGDVHCSLKQENDMSNHVRSISEEAQESLNLNARLTVTERQINRSENKSQISNDYSMESDIQERKMKKSGKGGDENVDELDEKKRKIEGLSARKKKGKRKAGQVVVNSSVVIPEPMVIDKGGSELDVERNTHKKPFTLITPTIHTGFSFSIIHLLSAVRKALITPQMEDTEDIGNHLGKDDPSMLAKRGDHKMFINKSNGMFLSQSLDHLEGSSPKNVRPDCNLPALSVHEIVHRVKSNPGDPCILETPEPLQDLVRGVLKIFSSKTAPLGAKGWKALVLYDKSIKSWSWVGPVSSSSSDNDNAEEETSSEAWNIPHKMLVKLVDAFANWLKNGQETLQQIGSLPAPPAVLPVMDYKDRFRDLRAQKSLNTISSSTEELRAYFHREELLRYSIPDRAFQYTAVDGRKSIVAPLRRGGGKPTSKARDHYMLKTDRPPHVTVLCLVRDAASRLPGSIGTRADVCTLIRDSQYIVEDVTDAQINQVVSGALDRLHYERDPCVQFDGERKLWVYLHHDREEEDFEDDGTSSTKKWKRQRKDPTDPSEVEATNESNYLAVEESTAGVSSACDFNPDPNIISSDPNIVEKGELVYNDLRPNIENVQSYVNSSLCERGQINPINWALIGGNSLQETKMLCQENSKNQDFDDESFSRERPVGLLSTSLF